MGLINGQSDTSNHEAPGVPCRSRAHAGAPRGWPSASEQLAASHRAAWQYVEAPRKHRITEREAVVRRREQYRQSTDYAKLQEGLQQAVSAYCDDWSFDDFGREFYVAGVSVVRPRRRNERSWVLGEDERRCWRRIDLIERAKRLDEIDSAGGFDSAAEYDYSLPGPADGDNHTNRTWQTILRADTRLIANVISCRSMNWGPWLRRLILRWSVPVLFLALGVSDEGHDRRVRLVGGSVDRDDVQHRRDHVDPSQKEGRLHSGCGRYQQRPCACPCRVDSPSAPGVLRCATDRWVRERSVEEAPVRSSVGAALEGRSALLSPRPPLRRLRYRVCAVHASGVECWESPRHDEPPPECRGFTRPKTTSSA